MPSDTPPRCEPPEEWRHVRDHWVRKGDSDHLMCWSNAENAWAGVWGWTEELPLDEGSGGYTYHAPALPDAAAEIERLRSALQPFADVDVISDADDFCSLWEMPEAMSITLGDLRRARAALARERTA